MNIEEAKQEIIRTIEIYLSKNEDGSYLIPVARQRPIFLLGAPGIGKTTIMEKIAKEMKLGLVSYTITHHTRQSAIGLPRIVEKEYGGKSFAVSEYTLSEIITSVYEAIEKEGKKEGILFIDEINCVSETLAPAMLDLLQNKKFGPHHIPDGWVLVSAGNPPEFNKSVKEFDVVTLDRLKKIEVTSTYDSWKQYAAGNQIDGSILYFLALHPDCLLKIKDTVTGASFVTPRGWEDLSILLGFHQKMGYKTNVEEVMEYVQDEDIAKDFFKTRKTYLSYAKTFDFNEILEGKYSKAMTDLGKVDFNGRLAFAQFFSAALLEKLLAKDPDIGKMIDNALSFALKHLDIAERTYFLNGCYNNLNYLDYAAKNPSPVIIEANKMLNSLKK